VDMGASNNEVAVPVEIENLPYKLLKKFWNQATPFCRQASVGDLGSRFRGFWPGRQLYSAS
jgi:hypothetical protein